jgi:hypothetical protein
MQQQIQMQQQQRLAAWDEKKLTSLGNEEIQYYTRVSFGDYLILG